MKILIVGNGGREHALAWVCAASASVSEVLVAPGNAGTAAEPRVRNAAVGAADIPGLIALARAEQVDLTIIGPETPLVMGVVDEFRAAGLRCCGPARRIEGLHQGIPAPPRHSDGGVPQFHAAGFRRQLAGGTTPADRDQG